MWRRSRRTRDDDAGRYQPKEEVEDWRGRDPLRRYERFLRDAGLVDDEMVEATEADAKEFGRRMRDGVIGSEPRPLPELFEWIFDGDLPPALARQRDELLREAGWEG